MLPPDRARSRSPDLCLLSGVNLPALLAQVVAFQAVTSSYDRSAGLRRAPCGDGGHGSALGDMRSVSNRPATRPKPSGTSHPFTIPRVPRTASECPEPRRDGTGPDRVSIAFTSSDADIRTHHDLTTPGQKRHRPTWGKIRQAHHRPRLPPAGHPHDHHLAGA